MNKYKFPYVKELVFFSQKELAYFHTITTRAYEVAKRSNNILKYQDSTAFDLTTPGIRVDSTKGAYAGTTTFRGYNRDEYRLTPKRVKNFADDDLSHNLASSEPAYTDLLDLLSTKGDVRRVSFATLNPGGWWPAHFDFSCNHAFKINYVLKTNNASKTLFWNNRDKRMFKSTLQEKRFYWLNSAFKHTAINFGLTDRVHLLATFKELYGNTI